MDKITYTDSDGKAVTLPLGWMLAVHREGACLDICLARAVSHRCPLTVQILIRTTGIIDLWATIWDVGETNTYWHFGAGGRQGRRPTENQLHTLERMFLGLQDLPGGLTGTLGHPVALWAFEGQTSDGIAAKHGQPRPLMNG